MRVVLDVAIVKQRPPDMKYRVPIDDIADRYCDINDLSARMVPG
jgi:hypothetical protein